MKYYKTFSELPSIYKQYLKEKLEKTNSYCLIDYNEDSDEDEYCPNCYSSLKDNKCIHCNIDFSNVDSISCKHWGKQFSYDLSYLVIEANSESIIAYITQYVINYDKDFETRMIVPARFYALLFDEKGILDLLNKNDYIDLYCEHSFKIRMDINYPNFKINIIYQDNLKDLNNNCLYQYIDIEKYKKYINMSYYKTIYKILAAPIVNKKFEYLIKMELYSLAYYGIDILNNGKSFNEIFGVPKSYYNMMKKNNIDQYELVALQLYNTDNYNIVYFLSTLTRRFDYSNCKSIERDKKKFKWFFYLFKKDMEKLYEYTKNQKSDFSDYYDYIEWAKKLKLDIKSNSIKYPKDFKEEHNRLFKEIVICENKDYNNKLINIHNYLKINTYEDDKYIIFPAYDIASLVDESYQMNNCVRTYIDSIIDHDSEIYFMREKENVNKSLVTVEVFNGEVIQAKRKNNTSITEEDEKFLKKFERQYTIVDFS